MSARLGDGEVFDSAKLKNTVRFLIENDMRNVVIDLGNLEYLYSDTINAFIASNRHMLEVSGRIAILTEHPKVQDILKRAGLDNIMRIYRSEAEMIADSKEILRQTSSYRIEELQKISTQPVQEQPPAPRTEFDEFKMEMGARLGSKLDNNEVPQYQLGLTPGTTPAPTTGFGAPPTRDTASPYPSFNTPGFTAPASPETVPSQGQPGYVPPQPAPAFGGFGGNSPAFGQTNGTPAFGGQGQGFGANPMSTPAAPPNFDFPTVQIPVGAFGGSAQSLATPATPTQNLPASELPTDQADPRSRKPAQERMRSPNARRQQGRRIGGREFPGDLDEGPETSGYAEEPSFQETKAPVEEASSFSNYSVPPIQPNSLVEESRSPMKLILILVALVAIVAGLWLALSSGEDAEPKLTAPATPTEPVAEVTPATPPADPAPENNAPATTGAPGTQPSTVAPEASAPAPTASTAESPEAAPKVADAPAPKVEAEAAGTEDAPAPKTEPKAEAPRTANARASRTEPKAEAPRTANPPDPERLASRMPPASARRSAKTAKPVVEKAHTPPPVAAPAESEEETPVAVAPGKLRVTSTPTGAEVLVNFSKRGSTPVEINLQNNSNKIIVRLPGYKRFETTLPKNHPDRELDVVLEREGGEVARTPEPESPKVKPEPTKSALSRVEENEEGDKVPEDLPMARTAPERRPEPSTPKAEPPQAKVDAPPAPGDGPIGVIFLSSSPARADIIIDGKNTGKKTPAKVELPSGSHRIEMAKSGQRDVVDHQVNEGKNKALHLILK